MAQQIVHLHSYKNLYGSTNCLPPQLRWRNFTIKIGKCNSAQIYSQETQIPIHPNSILPTTTRQENTIRLLMRLLLGF